MSKPNRKKADAQVAQADTETWGAKSAMKNRTVCNELNDEQRSVLTARAMQIIYGSHGKATADCVRH